MTEPLQQAVQYWWDMAEQSLLAAQREFEAEVYSFAVNRIYYALFYGVSAALIERQLTFAKHSGVRSAFHREFIKSGLIETKWGEFYDELFEDRQEGDYLVFTSFDREYVKTRLQQCRLFLDKLSVQIVSLPPKSVGQ